MLTIKKLLIASHIILPLNGMIDSSNKEDYFLGSSTGFRIDSVGCENFRMRDSYYQVARKNENAFEAHLQSWKERHTRKGVFYCFPLDEYMDGELLRAAESAGPSAFRKLGELFYGYSAYSKDNLQEALRYYKVAAEGNDPESQFFLGKRDEKEGLFTQARTWYSLASQGGFPPALYKIGKILESEHKISEALEHYKLATEHTCDSSLYRDLAQLYEKEGRINEAIKWYAASLVELYDCGRSSPDEKVCSRLAYLLNVKVMSAEYIAEIAKAYCFVGNMCEKQGDVSRAKILYHKAIQKGSFEAYYLLARMYENKSSLLTFAPPPGATKHLYRMAAQHNYVPALCGLAQLLESEGELEEADTLYQKVAKQDCAEGWYGRGKIAEKKAKRAEAKMYYVKAALAGYIPSQMRLGEMFHEEQCWEEAYHYYWLAADQKHPDALCIIGAIFEKIGRISHAKHFYEEAFKQGHVGALAMLQGIIDGALKNVSLPQAFWKFSCQHQKHVFAPHAYANVCENIRKKVEEGIAFEIAGECKKARECYSFGADWYDEIAILRLGMLAELEENYSEAKRYYKVGAFSESERIRSKLGNRFLKEGNLKEARRCLALQDYKSGEIAAGLAILLEREGNSEGAEHYLISAVAGRDMNARFTLAKKHQTEGFIKGAIVLYKLAADIGHPQAAYELENLLKNSKVDEDDDSRDPFYSAIVHMSNKEYDRARSLYTLLSALPTVNTQPWYQDLLFNLGQCNESLGNHDEAVKCYHKASGLGNMNENSLYRYFSELSLSPHAGALYKLAVCKQQEGNSKVANILYTLAADLGHPQALAYRAQLMQEKANVDRYTNYADILEAGLGSAQALSYKAQLMRKKEYLTLASFYRLAADKTNVEALCWLGVLAENEGQLNLAEKYYHSAEQQNAEAAFIYLAEWYEIKKDGVKATKYYLLAAQKGNVKARYYVGTNYEKQKKLDVAKKYYQLAHEQGSAEAALALGKILEKEGKVKEAKDAYQKAVDRGCEDALIYLGACYETEGDIIKAKECYRKATVHDNGDGFFNLGQILEVERQDQEAMKMYESAAKLSHGPALYHLGLINFLMGKKKQGIDYYLKAGKQGSTIAACALGQYFEEQGNLLRAKEFYVFAHKNGDLEGTFRLGSIAIIQGNNKDAEAYLYHAATKGHKKAQYLLAAFCEEECNLASAKFWYAKVVEHLNPNPLCNTLKTLFDGVGYSSGETNWIKFPDQLPDKEPITIPGTLWDVVHYKLGTLHEIEGALYEAEKYYRLAADNGHTEAQYRIALLLEKRNQLKEAQRYYTLSAEANHCESLFKLGFYAQKENDLERAKKYYQAASDQGHSEAQYILGFIFEQEGNLNQAKQFYKLAADQQNQNAMQKLRALLDTKSKLKSKN